MTKHDWIAIAAIIISVIGNAIVFRDGWEMIGFAINMAGFAIAVLNYAREQKGRKDDQA